jgi:propanediol dehydratase small subunit
MDDTTHQFSRKVIDRAMTIEMNGGKLEDMFGHSADLQYLPEDQIMELSDFKPEYVNADEVMEAHSEYAETLQEKLVEKLDAINNCLKNTPFQVSYRVLNELCIYAGVLLDDGEDIDNAISKAVNQITLMKILPRIEGDEDMFVTKDGNKLEQLQEILGKDSASGVKLEEMKERLKNSSFTRFWP